jgi:hypothetical protein
MLNIYDLEVFSNFFLAGFLGKNAEKSQFFEISDWKDDSKILKEFLHQENLKLVGYNCLAYDYPIIHYILEMGLLDQKDPMLVTNMIYNKSNEIINDSSSSFPEWKVKIPQLDLMKIHHLDNKSKSATLKDIEFVIRHDNVEDLDFDPHSIILDDEDREKIILYNENDLIATRKFYFKSTKEIELRKSLSKKYRLNLINANDPKMGAEIFASKLAPKLGIPIWELKKQQTKRSLVLLKKCIFPYINFKTKTFQDVLKKTKEVIVYDGDTKGAWKDEVIFNKVKYKFGFGGLHGCIYPGIYQEDENNVIVSSDVTSYYPNLAIKNRFYPAHLTSIYCDVYENIFDERKMYPKGTPENYGLKIALNGTFGKSNDKYSFFKDLKYMLRTTINGQMLLAMLCERVAHLGQILMANTDGIEILIPKSNVEKYYNICKKWEKFTRLELEHGNYKKMVIRDVNNYLAIKENDDTYEKGCFEINKLLWKDHSMLIVPKALKAYYTKGTPVQEFIRNHNDMFDFYMKLKIRSNFKAEIRYVVGENINNVQLSKTTRYYASTNGGYIFRNKLDGDTTSAIKKNQRCTIANRHVDMPMSDRHVDYQFYERECSKIINAIDQGQLKLYNLDENER